MLFEAAPPSADDLSVRSCTLPRRGKHCQSSLSIQYYKLDTSMSVIVFVKDLLQLQEF